MPVDPWLSPPLLTALPGTSHKHFYRQFLSNPFFELEGFLSHPQTVYPSYLTPPLSLNPSNINMSQLMSHNPNGTLRISPQNIPPPSHMPQAAIPTSSATTMPMMAPQQSASMSPSGSMQSMRSPSPDKKNSSDISVDSPVDDRLKDGNALNMTISPNSSVPVATDIRTNSIAALRIKAKEHLENINKNLTMV